MGGKLRSISVRLAVGSVCFAEILADRKHTVSLPQQLPSRHTELTDRNADESGLMAGTAKP